jgi:hypothetical protein
MAFIVKLPEPNTNYLHGGTPHLDDDYYQYQEHGVLKVFVKSTNTTTYYAPGAWVSVTTTDDHEPKPKGEGGG